MSRFYRRIEPGFGENLRAGLVAGGLAAITAAVSFYFVRMFLAREPLEPLEGPESRATDGSGAGSSGSGDGNGARRTDGSEA
jgi:hypothetical protein